jgi:sugar transferase (PEP-CTERM system associated)
VSLRSVTLMMLEMLIVMGGVLCAAKLRFWNDPVDFEVYALQAWFGVQVLITILVFGVCFYWNDLYDLANEPPPGDQIVRVWQSLGAGCVILSVVYFLAPSTQIGRGVFFLAFALTATSITVLRSTLAVGWRAARPRKKLLILGCGRTARTVGEVIGSRTDLDLDLTGFLRADPAGADGMDASFERPVLGSIDQLQDIVVRQGISRVIVAVEDQRGRLPVNDLVNLRVQGVTVTDAGTILSEMTGRVWIELVKPSWFIYSEGFRRSKLLAAVKRFTDLVCALVALVVLSPLMVLIAAAVRLDSRGPALFRQVRVGVGGKHFEVLKFRSMRVDAEATGAQWATECDPRVTRLGRILRKYRLDELPQFINVIRGDMSFVGPRPERPVFVQELRKLIPYYDERHSVRPGVTGWAQVKYSYGASVEDALRKLEFDLFYIQNMSPLFDLFIMFQTTRVVLFGGGAR